MQDVTNQHIEELSALPKEYAIHLALNNNDVINNTVPYNVMRLELFMYRCIHKIPDKIRIVTYVHDDYPKVGILEIFENTIVYTVRVYPSTESSADFLSYYGNSMSRKYRKKENKLIRDYYVVTYSHGEVLIFSEYL